MSTELATQVNGASEMGRLDPATGRFVTVPLAVRFWPRVRVIGEDQCWGWLGSRYKNGYGAVYFGGANGGKRGYAHRAAYELTYGHIPDGLYVCHHCDNPPCCNPAHLFVGTNRDNQLDRVAKGRHYALTEPEKLARGERHGRAKLTNNRVREIRRRHAAGESQYALRRAFGIAKSTMQDVVHGRTWGAV